MPAITRLEEIILYYQKAYATIDSLIQNNQEEGDMYWVNRFPPTEREDGDYYGELIYRGELLVSIHFKSDKNGSRPDQIIINVFTTEQVTLLGVENVALVRQELRPFILYCQYHPITLLWRFEERFIDF